MPKLPRLNARQIVAALEKAGFSLARQSGSHMIYKNSPANGLLFLSTAQPYFTRSC